MEEWAQSKLALAECLAKGGCAGGYADAILVLSAVVAAVAAKLWPSRDGTDRRRFVEIWARYADGRLSPNLVSLPLLIQHLRDQGKSDTAETLRQLRASHLERHPLFDDMVISGSQVDVSETAVVEASGLPLKAVREYSYGNLFYRHFRSGYVHEYEVGSHGDEVNMSGIVSAVVYESWREPPHRRINFDVQWLMAVVRTACANAAGDWTARPLAFPASWWLDAS